MRQTISSDADSGLRQVLHVDNADPYRGAIQLEQNVDAVLAEVRRAREQPQSREFRKLAEIPMAIYLQACAEGWANDQAAWKKWMNDPANAAFRVAGGKA